MGALVNLICIAVATFAVLAQPAVAQGANTLTYPAQILHGNGSQTCLSEEQRERVRNKVKNATQKLLQESDPGGYFCGGSDWRRVAYLNMSDPSQQCPSVWREIIHPHRVCGRSYNSSGAGCQGVTYSTGSEQYDQVCGRIIGYQIGTPDAFLSSSVYQSIDTFYVDGISLTHGFPRQHIWTFAAGVDEQKRWACCTCPCVAGSRGGNSIPWYVGNNYFCESGLTLSASGYHSIFYPNADPLWDGQGCGPTSSCCTFNSPPWFNVTLPSPTTDDIEVRICDNSLPQFSDSLIQLLELYVK